ISLPPMTIGISIFSAAIDVRRAFSSARCGVPGAEVRFGSLTGCGTRRTPANAAFSATPRPEGGVVAVEGFSAGEDGAWVDILRLYLDRPAVRGLAPALRQMPAGATMPEQE